MAYTILITRQAKKDIDSLPTIIKKQLHKKLIHFSNLPDIKVVAKKLTDNRDGEYRLRVGDYRIIFDLDKHSIILLRIRHRKEVYL